MLAFLLVTAISIGLTLGINALFLKKNGCSNLVAILVSGMVALVSLGICLLLVIVVLQALGYEGLRPGKMIGGSFILSAIASWGVLNRKGNVGVQHGSLPSPIEIKSPLFPLGSNPNFEPNATNNQRFISHDQKMGTSKRTKITVGFAGSLILLASVYPPWVYVLNPNSKIYKTLLEVNGAKPIIDWEFLWLGNSEYWIRTSIAWDRFALELVAIIAASSLLYVFMKDGKWPLKQ